MRSYALIRDLERRFDGDMPDELWRAALAGGSRMLNAILAETNSRCCDRLALSATRAAALQRADGDVRQWRNEGLHWRLEASDSSRIWL